MHGALSSLEERHDKNARDIGLNPTILKNLNPSTSLMSLPLTSR